MVSNLAFKIISSIILIWGLVGFMSSSNNTLIHLGLFLSGLTMLMISGVFDNATKIDNWVQGWGKDGKKQ